ncbi:MAG: amidohydrolase [Bacteroidota bacterium]
MFSSRIFQFIFLSFISLLVIISCDSSTSNNADIVFVNGNIATLNDTIPDAEAIAIKNDTIQSVGSNLEIEKLIGENTEIIDLNGKFVMPGFVESHAHFMSLGNSMMILDLNDAVNWDEIIAQVAEATEKTGPGPWIVGRGWHQEKWDPVPEPNVEGYPIHDILSSATPFNPVLLYHASGHAIFANKKAMELAGINTSTSDPDGGRIVRDSLKNAIGVFEEDAEYLISKKYNAYINNNSAAEKKKLRQKKVELAVNECLRNGITSFHDAGESFDVIDFLKEEIDSGNIKVRLNIMVSADNNELKKNLSNYRIIGYGNNFLNVRSIKVLIDGALGSRGAWMFDEYSDLPGHTGMNVTPLHSLRKTAELAINNGFQLCTHAIGDKGNRVIMNIYESTFKKHSEKHDLRWRIEHAQHLSKKDIKRFSQLDVVAAMQGIHCTSDAVYVEKRLGNYRAKQGAYVWRKLIDSGALICNGTDAPVESINTIDNFYATVTRKLPDGSSFYPDQKMSRIEALKSYTINGAYASFQEDKIGSIEPGKLADIVVLSKDLLKVPDEEIKNTKVLMTMVGGKILYSKE